MNSPISYLCPLNHFGAPKDFILSTKLYTNFFLLGGTSTRFAISFYPNVDIRIFTDNKKFADSSLPVRTPNLKVGGNLYYNLMHHDYKYAYCNAGFYHYSNGQDGPAKINGIQNTTNGNFSTNWFNCGMHLGTFSKFNSWYMGINFHMLQKWIEHDKNYDDTYGNNRLTLQGRYSRIANYNTKNKKKEVKSELAKERHRIAVEVSFATNKMEYPKNKFEKRINVETSYNFILPWSRNVGLFVATGYYGEDPYNVYYLDSYPYLKIGISTSSFGYRRLFFK